MEQFVHLTAGVVYAVMTAVEGHVRQAVHQMRYVAMVHAFVITRYAILFAVNQGKSVMKGVAVLHNVLEKNVATIRVEVHVVLALTGFCVLRETVSAKADSCATESAVI